MIRMMTNALRDTLDKLYSDANMTLDQREKLNLRICKQVEPRTTAEGAKMVQALNAMLMARVRPFYGAFTRLVKLLSENGGELSTWERTFIRDVERKLHTPGITPIIIKKVRQIAHKHGVECGFPGFRELGREPRNTRNGAEEEPCKNTSN